MSTTDTNSKLSDVKQKATDLKNNVTNVVQQKSAQLNDTMQNVQSQLVGYGNQIQELLGNYSADIQDYKFSVEKKGEGLAIDVAFKATITPRESGSISE